MFNMLDQELLYLVCIPQPRGSYGTMPQSSGRSYSDRIYLIVFS